MDARARVVKVAKMAVFLSSQGLVLMQVDFEKIIIQIYFLRLTEQNKV